MTNEENFLASASNLSCTLSVCWSPLSGQFLVFVFTAFTFVKNRGSLVHHIPQFLCYQMSTHGSFWLCVNSYQTWSYVLKTSPTPSYHDCKVDVPKVFYFWNFIAWLNQYISTTFKIHRGPWGLWGRTWHMTTPGCDWLRVNGMRFRFFHGALGPVETGEWPSS
jgi:hypothetical protein